ncbi:MAG TPA: type II secretion system protein [Vicinamibacteria bacterium]|nr:type II secretion system protein [Vicinamibacteria bacterium]
MIGRKPGPPRGFTFIEMVIVIVMLGILLGIAVPVYQAQLRVSKESVLKHNLAILRERLDQFKADRNKYPASLDELVEGGYLREIPEDPMTSQRAWEEIFTDYDPNEPDAEPGVYDVKSQSAELGTDGRPYSEW